MTDKAEKITEYAQRALNELDAAHKVIEAIQHLPRVRALRVVGAACILHGFGDIAGSCAKLAETLEATGEDSDDDGNNGEEQPGNE